MQTPTTFNLLDALSDRAHVDVDVVFGGPVFTGRIVASDPVGQAFRIDAGEDGEFWAPVADIESFEVVP